MKLQVLLAVEPGAPSVAGLPCAVRAAFRAGKELAPDRIVICGADDAFLKKWAFQFRACGAPVLSDRAGATLLDPRLPVLAIAADAFPDADALTAFAAAAEARGSGRRLVADRPAAVYARDARALGAGQVSPDQVLARTLAAPAQDLDEGAFFDARTPAAAAASARVLYSRLGKDNDGYLARFDRTLSVALTRLMLPFPITPNQVTAASLLVGLLGAWWLASGDAATQFLGAFTLWFCALLDGCDGEIARLKHHITPHGGEFDLAADHVAHLATFVALPIGVARAHPGQSWWVPGILLVTGFAAAGFAVWRLVLCVPEEDRGPLSLVVERVASRDYIYLILACTVIGRLDWFVWAAGIGSHLFWLWLWRASRR